MYKHKMYKFILMAVIKADFKIRDLQINTIQINIYCSG